MAKRTLVIGTRNAKKLGEIIDLLDLPEIEIQSLARFPNAPEVVEDGATFLENATKKAVTLATSLGQWVMGEDSGLVVDALDGMPGIYSARFAGEPSDDERNNDKLLASLASVPPEQRTAHYICTAVIADPAGQVQAWSDGRCDGLIIDRRRGTHGFGYDPLFLIPTEGKTFGELDAAFKQANSHRSAALRKLRPLLLGLIQSGTWK